MEDTTKSICDYRRKLRSFSYTPSHKKERKERQQRKTTKQRSETKHKTFKHFFQKVEEQVIEGRLGDVPM